MFVTSLVIAAAVVSVYARDTNSYTPIKSSCMDDATSSIFLPQGYMRITDKEYEWVQRREQMLMTTWQEYFDNVQLEGFEDFAWNTSSIPRVALAASGDGHRASLSAFSVLSAFDMRNA